MKKLISYLILTVAAAVLMGSSMLPASAQLFATFTPNYTNNPFVFTNAGSSSTFTGTSVPVTFYFQSANSTGSINAPILATMSLTSSVSGTAVAAGSLDGQGLQNVNITFTADTPISGQTNLLTVTGADGTLLGTNGTKAVGLQSSPGAGLNYSSSFLDFSSSSADSFSLSFLQLSAGLGINGNGYLNTVHAGGSNGLFNGLTSNPVPEPSSLATVGGLLLAFGSLCFIRMRRAGRQSA